MAEFDPIANISRFSGTPDAQKRAAQSSRALQDLMTKRVIQSDADIGAGQRQKASDLSRLIGTLAPHGLSPEGLSPEILGNIRGQIASERAGSAIANAAKGGVRFLGNPFQLSDVHRQVATPGQLLSGEAMEKMKGRVQAKLAQGEKLTDIVGPENKPVGSITKRERTKRREITGQAKSVSPEQANTIIKQVAAELGVGLGDVTNVKREGNDITFTVEGVKKIVRGYFGDPQR